MTLISVKHKKETMVLPCGHTGKVMYRDSDGVHVWVKGATTQKGVGAGHGGNFECDICFKLDKYGVRTPNYILLDFSLDNLLLEVS